MFFLLYFLYNLERDKVYAIFAIISHRGYTSLWPAIVGKNHNFVSDDWLCILFICLKD